MSTPLSQPTAYSTLNYNKQLGIKMSGGVESVTAVIDPMAES